MWFFSNNGPRRDISGIVRRYTTAGERGNGQVLQRRAAGGG